jgi:hypothetical protein
MNYFHLICQLKISISMLFNTKKHIGTDLSETKRISIMLLYLHKRIEKQINETQSTIPWPSQVLCEKEFQVMEMSMCL